MANAKHSEQTVSDGIHIPYAFEYANEAARTGASGFTSADVGKFARQLDNNSIWMLTATTPTWVRVSESGSGGGGSGSLANTLDTGNTTDGYDIDLTSGSAIVSSDGNVTVEDNLYVYGDGYFSGKLTVVGLIDPTGLVLDTQSSVPGGVPGSGKATLWVSDTDGYLMVSNDAGDDEALATQTYVTNNITSEHGGLSGLGDDDHTQYLLVSGSRAMTGSLDMGANAITNVGNVDGVDVSNHSARHENGGADEISVAGLSGQLSDPQIITVRRNSGPDIGSQPRLNFIEGSNISFNISNDSGNNELDITINSTGGGGGGGTQTLSTTLGLGNTTDGYDIAISLNDAINTEGDNDLLLERNSVSVFSFGTSTTDAHSRRIINITDPSGAQDAATKAYVDANSGVGGEETLSETLGFGNSTDGYDIELSSGDVLNTSGDHDLLIERNSVSVFTFSTSTTNVHSRRLINVTDPSNPQDAATKNYIDTNFTADHGGLSGLSDDDHSQYALLAGRAGGQTLVGGSASGEDLTLQSTSNVTRGNIVFADDIDVGGNAITNVGNVDGVDISNHSARHENGGADEISVTGLSGQLADPQAVTIRQNSGANIGSRPRINFIEGTNVSLTINDDVGDDEVEVTISSTDTTGGGETLSETLDIGNTTDGYDILLSSGDALNTSADHDLLLERNSVSVLTFGTSDTNVHSRKLINVVDPDDPQDAATKNYIDTNFTTDHGGLSGLTDDDHTQYLLVSGARAMTGSLDMGTNAITNVANVDGVDISAHASRHENGGADEISVEGLSGQLADPQAITIRRNSGADIGARPRINFIEGSNISLSISDDAGNDEIDVTITSTGGGGGGGGSQTLSTTLGLGNTTDGYDILISSGDIIGSEGDSDLLVERNGVSVMTFGTNDTNVHSRKLISVSNPENPQDAATKDYVDGYVATIVEGGESLSETLVIGNTTSGSDLLLSASDALGTEGDNDLLLERNSVSVFSFGTTTTDAHSRRIVNVTDPSGAQDAATKNYIDTNFTTDHGSLSGLGDDDHTQYLLVSGSRAMTGSLDMGANSITNVGNVDGVDVSNHSARHENGGADEISVAGLSGQLADPQIVTVRQNTGADIGSQSRLNFIEGSNVTLSISEDGANNEIDITINATDNDSSQTLSQTLDQGNTTDGYDIQLSSGDALNTSADHDLLIERNSVSVMTFGTGDTNIHSRKLINVTDPTNPQDAATKNYIDTNFTADHGSLTGLGDDDHTQYLLVSGSRAMTGSLDMGANAITNVANVDGVDISAHASRHENGGADELSVTGLSGQLADPQLISIKKDGSVIGTRTGINFVEGSNVTISVVDDSGNDEVDITISSLDNTGGEETLSETLGFGNSTDGYDIELSSGDSLNTSGNHDLLIERNSVSVFTFGTSATNVHSRVLTNVTDPTNPQDAATKNYIDTNFTTDHGSLGGLGDDDHTQYLLVSGTRAMTGDLDMGTNSITNVGNVDGVDVSNHSARHENGGADEISVTGLSGQLADPQTITVRQNTGADIGTRPRLNFIEGSNVTLSISDDAGGDEVDITINATDNDSSQTLSQTLDQGNTTDGYDILLSTGDAVNTNGDTDLLIERNSVSVFTFGTSDTNVHSRKLINVAQPTLDQDAATKVYVDDNIVSDHGGLTGLSDDDHTQYLLVSGSRAMTGSLDMGTNSITNVGNVDGVDVSAHSARHENGGADEISVTGLSGQLADPQLVTVKKDGSVVGTRTGINFIEGSNVTITVADDSGNDEVDVTIEASGGGVGGTNTLAETLDTGNTTDGYDILLSSGDALGTEVDTDLLIERNSTSVMSFGASTTDAHSRRIVNVSDPTSDQDAATKKYVDDNAGGGSSEVASSDYICRIEGVPNSTSFTANTSNFVGASYWTERPIEFNRLVCSIATRTLPYTLIIGIYQHPDGYVANNVPLIDSFTSIDGTGFQTLTPNGGGTITLDTGIYWILWAQTAGAGSVDMVTFNISGTALHAGGVPDGDHPTSFTTTLGVGSGLPSTFDPFENGTDGVSGTGSDLPLIVRYRLV